MAFIRLLVKLALLSLDTTKATHWFHAYSKSIFPFTWKRASNHNFVTVRDRRLSPFTFDWDNWSADWQDSARQCDATQLALDCQKPFVSTAAQRYWIGMSQKVENKSIGFIRPIITRGLRLRGQAS
jgi:hypothetical protein